MLPAEYRKFWVHREQKSTVILRCEYYGGIYGGILVLFFTASHRNATVIFTP